MPKHVEKGNDLMITIENAEVSGVTATGAVLIQSGATSYRIEIGPTQIAMLGRLCELHARRGDCSIPSDFREARVPVG